MSLHNYLQGVLLARPQGGARLVKHLHKEVQKVTSESAALMHCTNSRYIHMKQCSGDQKAARLY